MRYALITDIYSNAIALEAVLKDMEKEQINEVICLGDIVGYGPQPNETMDLIHKYISHCVIGEHDALMCGRKDPSVLDQKKQSMISWTVERLSAKDLSFLQQQPFKMASEHFTFVHGDIVSPSRFKHIDTSADATEVWEKRSEQLVFIGHTRKAKIFVQSSGGGVKEFPGEDFVMQDKQRYIVNVGCVGLPLDKEDFRATYCIYDSTKKAIYFQQVPYNMDKYVNKMKNANLDISDEAYHFIHTHTSKTTASKDAAAEIAIAASESRPIKLQRSSDAVQWSEDGDLPPARKKSLGATKKRTGSVAAQSGKKGKVAAKGKKAPKGRSGAKTQAIRGMKTNIAESRKPLAPPKSSSKTWLIALAMIIFLGMLGTIVALLMNNNAPKGNGLNKADTEEKGKPDSKENDKENVSPEAEGGGESVDESGTSTDGKGNGLDFTPAGSRVVISDSSSLDPGSDSFTVEAWVNVKDAGKNSENLLPIISKHKPTDSEVGWLIGAKNESIIYQFSYRDETGTIQHESNDMTLVGKSGWVHVAMIITPDKFQIFLDGMQLGGAIAIKLSSLQSDSPLVIGSPKGEEISVPVIVKDLRIWSRALKIPEIRKTAASSTRADKKGLCSEYSLTFSKGGSMKDKAGDNDGTIENAPTWN